MAHIKAQLLNYNAQSLCQRVDSLTLGISLTFSLKTLCRLAETFD